MEMNQNDPDEYIRQFNGKVTDFDSKEEKKEHQRGLKIYMEGITTMVPTHLNRKQRRAQERKKK